MKSVASQVSNAIRSEHNVRALPRLTAEWNLNRYVPVTVDNIISEDSNGLDIEMFPIETIIEPIRPTKGINKANITTGAVGDSYQRADTPRFYVASVDDKYKYWMNPTPSDTAGNISNAAPRIVYSKTVKSNKISITVENTWASPSAFTVQILDGDTWRVISTNPTIQNNGKIELWWNGTSWSVNKPSSVIAPTTLRGVMLSVSRMGAGRRLDGSPMTVRTWAGYQSTTGANSYLSVIEISARMEVDLTEKLIGASSSFDAGEASHLSPVGTITSNVGSVDLWNGDNYFSENTTGDLAGLIEPNVEMNLEYVYEVGTTKYPVQEFRLFVENWSHNDDSTVSVELVDASKYLKEVKPLPAKYERLTLSQILYRLCDAVGFTNYRVFDNVQTLDYKIPVFWTDGEKTLWEIFDDLAQATQSVIYFDSWGFLRVKTREDAYWTDAPVNWNLRARKVGTDLPDIESLTNIGDYESNVIKVTYKTAEWAAVNNGFTEMTTVWSPEETTTLRSTPLVHPIGADTMDIHIPAAEAAHWPFSGMVVVEAEIMEYEGKWFIYWNGTNMVGRWLKEQADYDKYNDMGGIENRHRNYFTGRIRITERGHWNTDAVPHYVDAQGYSAKRFTDGGYVDGNAGVSHNRHTSSMNFNGNPYFKGRDGFILATRGNVNDSPWKFFGTRLKFNSGGSMDQSAGLVFNQEGQRDGYYIELCTTNSIPSSQKRKQVNFYARKNGNITASMPPGGKALGVVEDTWYAIDVAYNAGSQTLVVFVNGQKIFSEHVDAGKQIAPNGRFGIFSRGRTNVDFEYLYAVAREEWIPDNDESSFHRILGVSEGRNIHQEWLWKRGPKPKRRVKKKNKNQKWKKNLQFFDEFGPYVHELRQFDVKYDPAPVPYSKVYSTNDWGATLVDFSPTSFGAKFHMANTARTNSVINGGDSLTFGSDDELNQHLLIYGRALVFGESEEIEVRNEAQARARGEIVTEINSDWIQTKEAAKAVAKWIEKHWSKGADMIEVSIFGNTLFEIGDVVAIDFPAKNMDVNNHQYFVVGINNSFDSGIKTTLTLRRKN